MKALRFGIIGWGIQATTQVGDIFCSDIDAVVLATPVRTHFQLAREALLHDKHVLVEKLLTNSVAQAEELIAQPRAHGGVGLQVVRVLASAQEALEQQANQGTTVSIVSL